MKSQKVCVDANIIVRVIAPNPEVNVQKHWQQWQDAQLEMVAPTLLRYEVTNSFHRMRLQGNVGDDLAQEMLETALALPLTFYDDAQFSIDALKLSRQFNLKASYDAHYLALSQHLGCELWTTDKRFFNAVHDHCDWVHLADDV